MTSGVNAVVQGARQDKPLHMRGEKRKDGFHPLQSLAVFCDFGDRRSAEKRRMSFTFPGRAVRSEGSMARTIWCCARRAFAEQTGRMPQAGITLTKICLSRQAWVAAAPTPRRRSTAVKFMAAQDGRESLREIGVGLGSDVPVCVKSQPAFMEGRGEILTPVTSLPRLPLLLVNPGIGVSTKDIFAALNQRSGVAMKLPSGGFSDGRSAALPGTTSNDLEAPAKARRPAIGELDALRGMPDALSPHVGLGRDVFALMPDERLQPAQPL